MAMDSAATSPLRIFVSYSHEDGAARRELQEHLRPLERDGVIRLAYDENVLSPGDDWAVVLQRAYGEAHVALLLVSTAYLASSTIEHELSFLLRHRQAGRLTIIPIFVGPSDVAERAFEFQGLDGRSEQLKLTSIQGIGSPKRVLQEVGRNERAQMLGELAQHLRKLAAQLHGGGLWPSSPRPPRIEYIRLRNVRSIEDVQLDFGTDPRLLTVIIGRNGTCKTTLLRAIAVALAGQSERRALLAHPFGRWITADRQAAEIVVKLSREIESREVLLQRSGPEEVEAIAFRRPVPPVLICGYGLGRSVAGAEPSSEYRMLDAVGSLFRYESRLAASELTLRRLFDHLGDHRSGKMLDSLKKALGLDHRYQIDLPTGGGIEIKESGTGETISFESWADGYRLTFLWLIDLFGWAMQAGGFDEDGDVVAIVLVDEIEQHLHPSMQRGLLAYLRKALPKVQWIVTTHSPLVALSAGHENIVSLQRFGERVVSVPVPSLVGYSTEDVLEEEALFGIDAVIPETREKLDRMHTLQRKDRSRQTPGDRAELKKLGEELDPSKLPYLREDPTLAKLEQIEALLRAGKAEK